MGNVFYDNKSQLKKETVKVGASTFDYNYTYDSYGRLYTKKYTDPNGRAEDITTDYNFADKVTKVTRKHTDPNGTQHTIVDRYTYDHGLRTKGHFHKIDNQAEKQLSLKNYTFKDQIAELNYGINTTSNQLQSIDYEYNTRGWLTGINKNASKWISSANQLYYQCGNNYAPTNPLAVGITGETLSPDAFMMELYYSEKDNNYLGSAKQYNGNIQAVTYQVFGVDRQAYGFAYDALDRMTSAQYGYLDNADALVFNSRYNESLSYDAKGNIGTLRRNGTTGTCIITNPAVPSQKLPAFSFGVIDNLRYTYNTIHKNRLESIAESASTAYGFKIKSGVVTSTAKYQYDKNGNLVKDPYKKITQIQYNHLNLPEFIQFDQSATSRSVISILYDAKGQKWAKKTETMVLSNTTPASWSTLAENTYYYDSGIEYRTGSSTAPDILQVEEGRMVWIPTSRITGYYDCEYAIRDHLGNTRVMVSDRNSDNKIDMKTEIMQVNHYYPFGMNQDGPWLAGNSGDHKYQYNGKELNTEFGLDWNDYGARYYDVSIARWQSVDPLTERAPYWSQYNYCENNPMRFIDPNGMEVDDIIISYTDKGGQNQQLKYIPGMQSLDSYSAEFKAGIEGLNSIYQNEPNKILEIANSIFFTLTVDVNFGFSENSMAYGSMTDQNGDLVKSSKGYEGFITYDAFSGMVDENNNRHAPISGLYHELQHGYLRYEEAKKFNSIKKSSERKEARKWLEERERRFSSPTGIHGYMNWEEYEVTPIEARYQERFLGENPRPNHRGKAYITTGSFSTESATGEYPKY